MKATEILENASQHMRDRAATYDKPDGERSMAKAVAAFNTITGQDLSTAEGWEFMAVLKQVRAFQNPDKPHRDSLEDLAAYSALLGEEMLSAVKEDEAVVAKPESPEKLKVGQVWKDREGREWTIDKSACSNPFYPFMALGSNRCWREDGRYVDSSPENQSSYDLIELVLDVREPLFMCEGRPVFKGDRLEWYSPGADPQLGVHYCDKVEGHFAFQDFDRFDAEAGRVHQSSLRWPTKEPHP